MALGGYGERKKFIIFLIYLILFPAFCTAVKEAQKNCNIRIMMAEKWKNIEIVGGEMENFRLSNISREHEKNWRDEKCRERKTEKQDRSEEIRSYVASISPQIQQQRTAILSRSIIFPF